MDYKSAGVDIHKADNLIDDVKRLARSTHIPGVMGGVGGFGSLFSAAGYKDPVMVSSTDGVGTKILLAKETGIYTGLGYDLVAMCVDDVVCCGAKPLFFLDYYALGKLEEKKYLQMLESITGACRAAECALIGGETAELPGMYRDDEFDLAGFTVGMVERKDILDPKLVKPGDAVIGLASSGFHSNGYSLVRKVVRDKNLDLNKDYGFGRLGEALMTPTAIYSSVLVRALSKFGKKVIKGIAHITGGGLPGNLCRVLPDNINARVNKNSWDRHPMFDFICREGEIAEAESYEVFNMGIGMALVVDAGRKDKVLEFFKSTPFKASLIGETVSGKGEVELV